jgi:hypothetical protein
MEALLAATPARGRQLSEQQQQVQLASQQTLFLRHSAAIKVSYSSEHKESMHQNN